MTNPNYSPTNAARRKLEGRKSTGTLRGKNRKTDYRTTSTGAMADLEFSKRNEEENKRVMEEMEKREVNRKDGGSICARPTGKGMGAARTRNY